jgi:hypothetical protein
MDTQPFLGMIRPKRSAPSEIPITELTAFYGALRGGDDDQIAAKLRELSRQARVVAPSWQDFIASRPHFTFLVDVFDRSDPGKKRWLDYRLASNLVTREGLGYLIGCGFGVTSAPTKKANFFVTQAKASMASIATADTASTHSNFTEIAMTTDVSQTVRPTLTLAGLSTGADLTSCDNSGAKAVFNHLTSITVYGLGLFSVNAAGTSSGYTGDILYGETAYGTALVVQSGYEVDVQGTVSATAG